MHVSIEGLFEVNAVLSRGLNGVDAYSGERGTAIKELPPGIFRHLRRLHRAIKDELELIEPERKLFLEKWLVDGKTPAQDAENFPEYLAAYREFFGEVITIPFSDPFKTEILEDMKIVLPVDIQTLMENINDAIADEKKEKEPPATANIYKGPESPKTNV